MYRLTDDNFDDFIDKIYTAATLFGVPNKKTREVLFWKDENRVMIANGFFIIDIRNIIIDIPINIMTPVLDLVSNKWISYKKEGSLSISETVEKFYDKAKFVGKTSYYASEILSILNEEPEKVQNHQSRYIFCNGYIPDNCERFTFDMIGGEPVCTIPGFKVSEDSMIEKRFLSDECSYVAEPYMRGDDVMLNVITKYGKTRSGLLVSDTFYDPEAIGPMSNFFDIHPALMACSNFLEVEEDDRGNPYTMPPIHIESVILYSVLPVFSLCGTTRFFLNFQEKVATEKTTKFENILMLESESPNEDKDPKIFVFMSCLLQDGGIKRG